MADEIAFIQSFADFISESPTSYHAADTMAQMLTRAGFEQLDETAPWSDVSGARFVVREGAVIAWRTPAEVNEKTELRIIGSHTDSPALKLKPSPDYMSDGWSMLNMEIYGGPLMNSWLDRELGLAGRLVTLDGEQALVRTDPILRIPQLAPHLDRSVNESLSLSKQQNMMPFRALGNVIGIEEQLCAMAGIELDQLGYHDIFTFPTEAPAVFGAEDEFFAASRQDNLSSVFTSLAALLEVDNVEHISVLAAFDHEEVGSGTTSGAAGPFLADMLVRIAAGLGYEGDAYQALLARSSCISADAGHSVNPNYVGKHDPTNHPLINRGPVLKINSNQRYATDARGGALFRRLCNAASVPMQTFVGNNDVPCGTTIGPLTATRLGILTVDVGIPLLSMHSAREMCGVSDPLMINQAFVAYWSGV